MPTQEPVAEVNLPIVTTNSIPYTTIVSTLGLACGEAIMGANFLRDIAASVTDIVGGRSGSYEAKLREGRLVAVQEMMNDAHKNGANSVIGVKIDYETVGNSMLMVVCTGTAAIVEPIVTQK
ncbi:MAG: YbjQ family protein [Akkermansiaceae bacterium]